MTRQRRSRGGVEISPEILERAPHLGLIDVVDHALHVAALSLYAELPALFEDPHPWRPEPPEQAAARRMLRQMYLFTRAVERYRRALAPSLPPPPAPPDHDVDF